MTNMVVHQLLGRRNNNKCDFTDFTDFTVLSPNAARRVGCIVSKNRSFGLQSSTFGVLCEMQWRIRFCNFFPFSKFFSYQELRVKKGGAPLKVKIFFSTDVLFMILKRSVFEIQKQLGSLKFLVHCFCIPNTPNTINQTFVEKNILILRGAPPFFARNSW